MDVKDIPDDIQEMISEERLALNIVDDTIQNTMLAAKYREGLGIKDLHDMFMISVTSFIEVMKASIAICQTVECLGEKEALARCLKAYSYLASFRELVGNGLISNMLNKDATDTPEDVNNIIGIEKLNLVKRKHFIENSCNHKKQIKKYEQYLITTKGITP